MTTETLTEQKKSTVLVVDDHPMIRDWLSQLINEEADLAVCGAVDNAEDAIQTVERLRPDLIIVDIGLRGKSGLELIRSLHALNPEENILVLSMHEEPIYTSRALKAGARGYVTKRETSEKVVHALRHILKGGVYLTDHFSELLTRGKKQDGASPGLDVSLLSDRELEVFRLLAMGRDTAGISLELNVSQKTVQSYCARIKDKLNLRNATELLQTATRWADAQNGG